MASHQTHRASGPLLRSWLLLFVVVVVLIGFQIVELLGGDFWRGGPPTLISSHWGRPSATPLSVDFRSLLSLLISLLTLARLLVLSPACVPHSAR